MSRVAAARIASRVPRPSRILGAWEVALVITVPTSRYKYNGKAAARQETGLGRPWQPPWGFLALNGLRFRTAGRPPGAPPSRLISDTRRSPRSPPRRARGRWPALALGARARDGSADRRTC